MNAVNYLSKQQVLGRLAEVAARALQPKPKLTISEWATKYAYLPEETSAQPGKYEPWAFQPGIMDAFNDPDVMQVTVKKSTRVGWTETCNMVIGFHADYDPCPISFHLPTKEQALAHSEQYVDPFIEANDRVKRLLEKVADNKKQNDKRNLKKFRTKAVLRFKGAQKAMEFRKDTVRVILLDEYSDYPASVQGQGSPVALANNRIETYEGMGIVGVGSTPTNEGECLISVEYELSDKRRFMMPCPHCDELITFEWGGKKEPFGIKWDSDDEGNPVSAYYVCQECGGVIEQADKFEMIEHERAGWVATATAKKPGNAGFHISALYSYLANTQWLNLAKEYLLAFDAMKGGDVEPMRSFRNNRLGETWAGGASRKVPKEVLEARNRDEWGVEVPDEVQFLTIAADVQGNGTGNGRVEWEVVGWATDRRSWQIAYGVIDGDFALPEVQDQLLDEIKRPRTKGDGTRVVPQAGCVDSGGHFSTEVVEFCRRHRGRRIFAIKGASERPGPKYKKRPIWPREPSKNKATGLDVYMIGTHRAKDQIWAWREALPDQAGHIATEASRCPENWWKQMDAERPIVKSVGGINHVDWRAKAKRNEALDVRVYNLAAFEALVSLGLTLAPITDTQEPVTTAKQTAPVRENFRKAPSGGFRRVRR